MNECRRHIYRLLDVPMNNNSQKGIVWLCSYIVQLYNYWWYLSCKRRAVNSNTVSLSSSVFVCDRSAVTVEGINAGWRGSAKVSNTWQLSTHDATQPKADSNKYSTNWTGIRITQCRHLFLLTSGEFVYGTPTYTSSYVLWGNSDPKSSGDQSLLSSLSVLSSSFLLPVSPPSHVKRISYRPTLSATLRLLALNKAHAYAIGF